MKTPIFLLPLLFATAVYAGEPVPTMIPGPHSDETAAERAQVSQDALDQAHAPAPDARQSYQNQLMKTGVEAHKAEAAQAEPTKPETFVNVPVKEASSPPPPPPQHLPCATAEACLLQVVVEKWFAAEVAAAKTEALQRAAPK